MLSFVIVSNAVGLRLALLCHVRTKKGDIKRGAMRPSSLFPLLSSPHISGGLADEPAVLAVDRNHRGAGNGCAAVREVAVALFAGMLDANEKRAPIRAPGDAGNFGFFRSDQKAFDLARRRVAEQHLVVAHALEIAAVGIIAVRLDPEV